MAVGDAEKRKIAAKRTADWLHERLRARDWNGSDLARALDVNSSTVSRWLRAVQPPTAAYCDLLADVFGADVDFVLTLAGHRPEVEPIDPDDPRARIMGMLRRVDLDRHDRAGFLEDTLRRWIAFDREHPEAG